jgi:serine/arginine repetitive matrix protein 1
MDGSARPYVDEEAAAGSGSGGEPERPFEHWYRGEAARNGGVGELKIGKAEMLDIAQFGYTKTKLSGVEDFRKVGTSTTGALRRRAGSFDGKRESWIMEEAAYGLGKVIDESPLTDLEGDEYTTEGERNYPYPSTSTFGVVNSTSPMGIPGSKGQEYAYVDEDTTMSTTPTGISSVPAGPYSSRRGTITNGNGTPTPSKQQSPPASRIATANGRQPSSPPSAGSKTPLGTNNGASAKSSLLGKPTSKNGKGKAKSGIPKKGSRTLSSADQAAQQEDEQEGEQDGVEKIPFRNPPTKGNWDDIVLPAVTKKMGIDGYGLKSEEGNILEISEEVRKRMSAIQPPVRFCYLQFWFVTVNTDN